MNRVREVRCGDTRGRREASLRDAPPASLVRKLDGYEPRELDRSFVGIHGARLAQVDKKEATWELTE